MVKKGKPSPSEDRKVSFYNELVRKAGVSGTTGRHIIMFHKGANKDGAKALARDAGFKCVNSAELSQDDHISGMDKECKHFELLHVCIAQLDKDQLNRLLRSSGDNGISRIAPETVKRICPAPGPTSADYLRGYVDGVNRLAQSIGTGGIPNSLRGASASISDFAHTGGQTTFDFGTPASDWRHGSQAEATWAVQAIGAKDSQFSGKGIRIAVLDTGIDFNHKDFIGRIADSRSFVGGTAQDDNVDQNGRLLGHGTNCAGIVCGPKVSKFGGGVRYGVAYDAELFVGKVGTADGSITDEAAIAGITWAIQNRCRVISMSFTLDFVDDQGNRVDPSPTDDEANYSPIAMFAKDHCLLVAAVGNKSKRRLGRQLPTGSPANSPLIVGVAAIDSRFEVADFSNFGDRTILGSEVDFAAPGVDILSAKLGGDLSPLSGTSQATPLVAGAAALFYERLLADDPDATPADVLLRLRNRKRGSEGGDHANAIR